MRFQFANSKLYELYTIGKYAHKYPKGVVDAFDDVMSVIDAAVSERDLYVLKSLHCEKLQGSRQGQHSLRLNKQYRLIIAMREDDDGRFIEVIDIDDYHR